MGHRGTFLIVLLGLVLLAGCVGAPPPTVPRNAPDDLQATAAWENYRQSAVATQTIAAQEAAAIAHALMATDAAATATTSAQSTHASQAATATTQAGYATATHQASIATAPAQAVNATATHNANVTTATAVARATHDSSRPPVPPNRSRQRLPARLPRPNKKRCGWSENAVCNRLKPMAPGLSVWHCSFYWPILGSWVLIIAMKAWDARQRVIANRPFGWPLVLLDGPFGRRTIFDPSRLFGPVVSVEGESVTMPQLVTPELQIQTTARSQAVELRQAAPLPYRSAPAATATPVWASARTATCPQLIEPELQLPADAPWSILHQQWQGDALPLGIGANSLLVADAEAYPRLLMAGTSGSGKTRFGLQPLLTSTLASGWQVAIYDRSGLDFLPFQQHPNAHTVLLEDPSRAVDHLAPLCEIT